MKSVLISIQPKWCELIASGKKTIEIRKTRPQLETPFKCYIYCTQNRFMARKNNGEFWSTKKDTLIQPYYSVQLSGKVVGEFVCDEIDTYSYHKGLTKFGGSLGLPIGTYDSYLIFEDDYKAICLTYNEVKEYGKGKPLYGWHISDLKIYDKPKELGEFLVKGECENFDNCWSCPHFHEGRGWLDGSTCDEDDCELYGYKPLTRPFQSWGYVEDYETIDD